MHINATFSSIDYYNSTMIAIPSCQPLYNVNYPHIMSSSSSGVGSSEHRLIPITLSSPSWKKLRWLNIYICLLYISLHVFQIWFFYFLNAHYVCYAAPLTAITALKRIHRRVKSISGDMLSSIVHSAFDYS